MEKFTLMLGVQATLFIYIAVGIFVRKRGMITPEVRSGLSDLLVNVLLPCMVFNSFHVDITPEELLSASMLLGMAFAISFFSWLAGRFFYRRYTPEKEKILRYGTLVSNCGFAGLPLVQYAYGANGLFYASIFIIPNRIFMWSAGISLFKEGEKGAWVRDVLLNPGIVAAELGLARMLLKIPLPSLLDTAISSMGNSSTPISLITVGTMLADVDYRSIFSKDAFYLSFVRLIFLPGCAFLAMRAAGFDTLTTAIAVVMTGMPIGSTTAILAEKFGADVAFASKCVFVTTLLSLFTIPLLSVFL